MTTKLTLTVEKRLLIAQSGMPKKPAGASLTLSNLIWTRSQRLNLNQWMNCPEILKSSSVQSIFHWN